MKLNLAPSVLLVCLSTSGFAATIDVGTAGNASNWNLVAGTGSGPAFQAGPLISISPDGTTGTTPIAGFDNSTWDGVWTATLEFTLPTVFSGISLALSNPVVDDRWVLQLNGTNVADYARGDAGVGLFNFGSGDDPYTFSGDSSFLITSGFSAGLNTLTLFINNTDTGVITGNSRNLMGDATYAGFDAMVTYSETSGVPEPATWIVCCAGLVMTAVLRRRYTGTNSPE